MIDLVTGLPGNGKTLYALKYVKERAERENRPVFYSGINLTEQGADLLKWTQLPNADEWYTCPEGSIIVIDECQRVFRPRMHGKEVPKHVEELETHRHKGFDLVLITQHPMLADNALRRLVGKHLHVVRKFGTQSATIHEWGQVRENCEKPAGRVDSIKHHWVYDKSVYDWYKSAEIHTVKRNIPMKFWMLCVLPFVLAGMIYYVYQKLAKRIEPQAAPVPAAVGAPGSKADKMSGSGGAAQRVSYRDAKEDAKQFIFERTPRITGLDHTAPRYDEVTKPSKAPLPVACLSSGDRCTCYSQQATKLEVDKKTCLQIVANGFFVDHDQDKGQGGARVVQAAPAGAVKADTVSVASPEAAQAAHVQFRDIEPVEGPQNRPRPAIAQNTSIKSNTTPTYK